MFLFISKCLCLVLQEKSERDPNALGEQATQKSLYETPQLER